MSVALPIVNLTGSIVGTTGNISLKPGGIDANPANTKRKPNLLLYNESPYGLQLLFKSSQNIMYLPAGGWQVVEVEPGESDIVWSVIYVISATPIVAQFLVTYYRPGELVPTVPQLGNSPVGVSTGPVTVANQLINDVNAPGFQLIETRPVGDPQSAFVVTNDGKVAIGDAANGGSLSIVGPITATGRIQGDGTNNLRLDTGAANKAIEFDAAGVQKGFVDSNGLTLNTALNMAANSIVSGGLALANSEVTGNTAANGGGSLFLDALSAGNQIQLKTNGSIRFFVRDTGAALGSGTLNFLAGSLSRINFGFIGVVTTGTLVAHGLGATPTVVLVTNGSSTAGITITATSLGGTNFTATPSANCNIFWLAAVL